MGQSRKFHLARVLATVLLVSVIEAAASPPIALAQGALGTVTVGTFIQGLHEVIQQLETSAHSLIDQGNIALGQQQMLLAGILQQTLAKINSTYAASLNATFGQLNVAEQNSFGQLFETVNQIKDLESRRPLMCNLLSTKRK
jgi:hypothetical protein